MEPDDPRFPRLEVDLRALRRSGADFVAERVVSLSAAGIALATGELLKPRSLIHLVIEYPDGIYEVSVQAEVVHVRSSEEHPPYVAGLKVVTVDHHRMPHYDTLLLHMLERPDFLRATRRLEVEGPALWENEGPDASPLPVSLVNVSLGGACIRGPEVPPPGQRGTLTLVGMGEAPALSVPAHIAWRRPGDPDEVAGVQFDPTEPARKAIAQAVRWFLFTPRAGTASSGRAGAAVRVGAFEVGDLLARGGMCDLYRGRGVERPFAGKAVALKRLRPEAMAIPGTVDRFLTEAEVGRLLAHEGLVRVFSTFEFGQEHWTAMELVVGPTLEDVLVTSARSGLTVPVSSVLAVADQLLEILDYCHRFEIAPGRPLEIVHGDVTPSNVMLSSAGQVKLIDFGVASTAVPERSELAGVAAKLSYLAPELYFEGGRPTAAVDVYQVGIVLYEALAGVKPFKAESPDGLCRAVYRGPAPLNRLNPDVTPELELLVRRSLAADPRLRPPGAAAFREALAAVGGSQDAGTSREIVRGLASAAEPKPPWA